jgi:hypothetical protein
LPSPSTTIVLPATVVVLRVSDSPEDEDEDDEDDDGAAAGVLEVLLPLLPPQPARARVEAADRAAKRSAARLFMMSPSLMRRRSAAADLADDGNPHMVHIEAELFIPRQNDRE